MSGITISLIGGFGSRPPPKAAHMLTENKDGIEYVVGADPQGFFTLTVTNAHLREQFQFSRLDFGGATGQQLLIFRHGQEGAKLDIGGVAIPLCADPLVEPAIRLGVRISASRLPSLPPIAPDVPKGASDAESLFIRAVHELQQAIGSNDPYAVLRASAMARSILLEGLLDKANRRFKQKFTFTTNDYTIEYPPSLPVPDLSWCFLSPESGGSLELLKGNKEKFLQATVLRLPRVTATVRDVVRACANALGGVHLGPAANPKEDAVLYVHKRYVAFGAPASNQALKDIYRVAVRALHPLVVAIQNS